MIVFNNLVFDESWLDEIVTVRESLNERISRIRALFGYKTRVRVLAFDHVQGMADYFGFSIPEWVKGTGYGDRVFLVRRQGWTHDFEDSVFTILLHELVHRAVEHSFALRCPLWLNEGLAINFSGELGSYDPSRCQSGYDYYAGNYAEEILFYTQSAMMVSLLIDVYGAMSLIRRCRGCKDFINDPVVGPENLARLFAQRNVKS